MGCLIHNRPDSNVVSTVVHRYPTILAGFRSSHCFNIQWAAFIFKQELLVADSKTAAKHWCAGAHKKINCSKNSSKSYSYSKSNNRTH